MRVFTEGDLDREVVEAWVGSGSHEVYPKAPPSVARPGAGKTEAIREALALASQSAITEVGLALDLNGGSVESLQAEVDAKIGERYQGPEFARVKNAIRLIPMGLKDDPTLQSLGIRSFASDDYVLMAARDPTVVTRLLSSEKHARVPAGVDPWAVVADLVASGRQKGFAFETSKGWLRIFRALIGVSAGDAGFAQAIRKQVGGLPVEGFFRWPLGVSLD